MGGNKFGGLTINAYGSRMQKQEKSSSLKFAVCQTVPHEDASPEEKAILKYLDDLQVFQLDAKQILQDRNEKDCHSPILAAQFQKKAQA